MVKKIFVSKSALVIGKKPVADFNLFDASTGTESRHRLELDISHESPEIRKAIGAAVVALLPKIASKIADIIYKGEAPAASAAAPKPLNQAVKDILLLKKSPSKSSSTGTDYSSIVNEFLRWTEKKSLAYNPVTSFSRDNARQYFDFLSTRKTAKGTLLSGTTINNKLTCLRAIFSALIEEQVIKENPFKAVEPAIPGEKNRRNFTTEEAAVVADFIENNHYWLFRGLLLQYYCYIRPVELTRLKFSDFNLTNGTVSVQVHKGKKYRRIATIPSAILPYFTDNIFTKYPNNHYVFSTQKSGTQYKPGPSATQAAEDMQYKQHLKVLNRLKKLGKLKDITGLTWYSWKDTGISVHAEITSPLATKDQAGHSSFEMTLKYYHPPSVIAAYQNLPNTLTKPK